MHKPKKRPLTWAQVDMLTMLLEHKIRLSKVKYRTIAGIARGGLIPAVILSHRLDIPMISITPRSLITDHDRCLLVDEIYDSGTTIKQLKEINPGVHAAVLFHNIELPEIEYFATKDSLDEWIIFPWEKINEEAS